MVPRPQHWPGVLQRLLTLQRVPWGHLFLEVGQHPGVQVILAPQTVVVARDILPFVQEEVELLCVIEGKAEVVSDGQMRDLLKGMGALAYRCSPPPP